MDRIFAIVQTLLVLAFVIFLAHISIRLMGRYTSRQNRAIKIIERVGVNNNSALAIVEIFGIYYLMSFTQGDNKILKELREEEVAQVLKEIEIQNNNLEASFYEGLKGLTRKFKKTDTYWNEGKK